VKVTGDGTARVEFEVRFPRTKGWRQVEARPEARETPLKPAPPQVPKVTRLLVLGYHFERLVSQGVVKDYAALSRLTGLSRARVTQLVNLTLLAPNIQAEILTRDAAAADRDATFERRLRDLTALPDWNEQRTRQSGRAAW